MKGPGESLRREWAELQEQLAAAAAMAGRVGEVSVGATPRELVLQQDRMRLYRYRPTVAQPHPLPLLIVYALVNRPYMVDIQPERSFVAGLLARGLDVYLIDWGYATAADRYLDFDDYLNGYIKDCLAEIRRRHGLPGVGLAGVCQGGVMALCYAALHPDEVAGLVTLVTPVDFQAGDNALARMARDIDIEALVDAYGTVPGEVLSLGYLALQPFQQLLRKYQNLPELAADEAAWASFLRMEKWIYDSPGQAGAMFRSFAQDCFIDNKLCRGELNIGGRRVDLGALNMPLLNVYATRDHLVPPPASQALGPLVPAAQYTEQAIEAGHIGLFVGRSAEQVQQCVADWWTTPTGVTAADTKSV